jgi:hypothetical protein
MASILTLLEDNIMTICRNPISDLLT